MKPYRPLMENELEHETLDAYISNYSFSESELGEYDSDSVIGKLENDQDEPVQEQLVAGESCGEEEFESRLTAVGRQYFFLF